MKLNGILLLGILSLSVSCTGQVSSGTAGGATKGQDVAIGHVVSQLDTSIWYVFHDSKENYWFGSNGQGVYRYDGKTLMQLTHKDGLCNDQVRGIQEDRRGNVYVNTVNGISRYDGRTLTTLKSITSDLPGEGWGLHADDLWFQGAQDSGVVYRYDGKQLYRLKFPKTKEGEDFIANFPRSEYPAMTFSPYDVYSIYRDSWGHLWFGTNIGVCRYDGKSFAWMSEKELGIDAISIHTRSTIEDKEGKFWFSNTMHRFGIYNSSTPDREGDVIKYRKEQTVIDPQGYNAEDFAYFMSAARDKAGDLWLVTYSKGVWRYDGKRMRQYPIKDGDKDATLFTIYQDHKGSLWLGTHTAGVYKYNGKTFERFTL